MENDGRRAGFAGLAAALLVAAGAGAGGYHAPRDAYGRPELEGQWTNAWLTRLERPDRFRTLQLSDAEAAAYEASPPPVITDDVGGNESEMWEMGGRLARIGGQARIGLIVDPPDGKLPYTPAGRTMADAANGAAKNFDGPEPRTTSEQCLLANSIGPPMLIGLYANNIQIVQTRDSVVFVLEWNHETRIVRLGDRRHASTAIRPWMGDSIGWWEGETLVVETINFSARQQPRRSGTENYYLWPDARVVERFTRTSSSEILYEFSVDDPTVYRQTWRGELPMAASSARTFEFACHEGNYSLPNILAGARAAEREAAVKTSGEGADGR